MSLRLWASGSRFRIKTSEGGASDIPRVTCIPRRKFLHLIVW